MLGVYVAGFALVPFQLSFAGDGFAIADIRPMNSNRSGEAWVRSARKYLISQAKAYSDAAAFLTAHLLNPAIWDTPKQIARDLQAQLELDTSRGIPPPLSPDENKLSQRPRAQLVDELMRDPLYTDGRLLSRLPHRKLARMVSDSRERAAAGLGANRRCA